MLDEVIAEEHADVMVEMVRVDDEEDAIKKRFIGSPTLRANDLDLFADQASGNYAMQCRVYRTEQGLRGVPSKEMLRSALNHVTAKAR
jgi:hypothetical protein